MNIVVAVILLAWLATIPVLLILLRVGGRTRDLGDAQAAEEAAIKRARQWAGLESGR